MKYNSKSGFTLIELLVVIAIIGILSAVVLASLNTARTKGNDAAIQSNFSAIRTQAEIFRTVNNNYGTTAAACDATAGTLWADPTVQRALTAAQTAAAGAAPVCGSTATAYAVQVAMTSAAGTYWCVDSSSRAATSSTALTAGATACP